MKDKLYKDWQEGMTQAVKPPILKVHPKFKSLGENYYCQSCGVMLLGWEVQPTMYCGSCGQRLKEDNDE